MSVRAASRIGWSLWAASVALIGLGELLFATSGSTANRGDGANPLMDLTFILFATVGALIVSRHPKNAIGWLCCAIGLDAALGDNGLGYGYVHYALFGHPGTLPAGRWVAWLAEVINAPSLGAAPLLLLLFPSGRLPSPRWRPVGGLAADSAIVSSIATALKPGALDGFPDVPNPAGLPGLEGELANTLIVVGAVVTGLLILVGAASVFLRLRHAQGIERQQLKWFAYDAALVAVAFLLIIVGNGLTHFQASGWLTLLSDTVWSLVVAGIPISIGVAILRYRLYDIDLIINRTLVYAALTASLALVYSASVVLLQQILRVFTGQTTDLAIVASTLAIAALFQPLRRRIQAFIDQRFYRRKYDAAQVLHYFGLTVRDTVELERLKEQLLGVVDETVSPAYVSLWLTSDMLGVRSPTADSGG